MPEIMKNLDVYQGYNFKKDKQSPVGFITKMKIGDKELTADQTIKDPMSPDSDLKVVAVLDATQWETGTTDALNIEGQVSVANKQELSLLVLKDMTKVDVTFQFVCYDYDPIQKKYYKSFHSNETDMKGLIEKRGSDLSLAVSELASTEVQSPENFTVAVGIKPQEQAQSLHVATASDKKVAKGWGLTVG